MRLANVSTLSKQITHPSRGLRVNMSSDFKFNRESKRATSPGGLLGKTATTSPNPYADSTFNLMCLNERSDFESSSLADMTAS